MNGRRPTWSPSPRVRLAWLWLLSLSLLGQALLPMQAHSHWQRDGSGRVVVLCTLQGSRTVRLQDGDDRRATDQRQQDHSPAMAYSALLAHAAAAALPACVRATRAVAPLQVTPPMRRPPVPLPERVAIRGPPLPRRGNAP